MADTHRSVTLTRRSTGVYVARNERGGELVLGSDAGSAFTPVELLLVALAGCSAVDVDVVTGRRAEPEEFSVRADAEKVREEGGSILRDIALTFTLTFPEGEAGDAAREVLPRALAVSHDRPSTAAPAGEAGVPVSVRVA